MEAKFLIFYSLILLERKVYSVNIEECPTDMINVTEDDELSLTCGPSYSEIEWYYSTNNTLGDYIGYCSGTRCNPIQSNKFRIHAEWSSWPSRLYKSILDITNVTREEAGFFHCKDSYSMYTCRLRVTVPANLVSENCNVEISNWKVQGTCQVARMYSSDSIYKCTWSVNNAELPSGFEEPLTNWTDRYTSYLNRTYMRGNCSFKQEMPSVRYSYTYKISVDPGLQNFFVKTINIEPPKKPEINCSETVLEGSTVVCMCTSQYKGNPPAKFAWDGIDTDRLLLRNVSRQQNCTKYTCRQTWGPYGFINTTVNYTLTVACTEESIRQVDEQKTKAKDSSSSGSINGGLIGGIVAAVVFSIIIGAVIVVFIVKRRKDPMYDTARRPANNEHNYEDLTQNRCEVRQPAGASNKDVTRPNTDGHM
ncbi:uncharacterized protein LOC112568218 isoform X2 [Pomacea canaliculata]|uniref:uncharacterized protein LOC112568218 isoform X2 n=1 Tax=Pomacea canaliculata TaxID=400727 RepID=UPI000D72A7D9|nr:uncharacterized protein LOC112568218 isoform X2 [Pomacea canaliculata]